MKRLLLIFLTAILTVIACSCEGDTVERENNTEPLEYTDATSSVVSLNYDAAATPVEEGKTYNSLTYSLYNDGTVEITGYDGQDTAYGIPSKINGVPVVRIGAGAFSMAANLTSVIIPNTVLVIDDGAFELCTSLETMRMSENVKSVGCFAFSGNPWFIAENQKFVIIGDGVLMRYNGVETTIEIPDAVKYISWAFNGNTAITSIHIPVGVTGMCNSAFDGCTALAEVNYDGTAEQWSGINFASGNEALTNAKLICGISETAPVE